MRQFKYFIVGILLIGSVSFVYAAEQVTPFRQNFNTQVFNPIEITASTNESISATHDIRLMLPTGGPILWEKDNLLVEFSGTASEKMGSISELSFSEDMRTVVLPVEIDFLANETLIISNLKVRTYNQEFTRMLGMDVDGDGISDSDIHLIKINNSDVYDFIPPYDPYNFEAVYDIQNKNVQLSWKNPPDYDFNQINLSKFITRIGKSAEFERPVTTGQWVSYLDTADIQDGDVIRYVLFATDHYGNQSNKIEATVTIGEEEAVEPDHEPADTDEPEPTPETEESDDPEIDLVSRLFNYYNVRYQIKCLAATANATSSACLWSKIDMVYAQELLNRSDVDVSLSAHDLYLMELRVKWPEARYQTNCIEATAPAKSCPALERSLKRIHYFID